MPGSRRILPAVAIIAIFSVALVTIGAVFYGRVGNSSTSTSLPPRCVKPADGFMIVASANGFNDSVDHGVPNNPWPVIDVKKGSTVTILVCNADIQAHGFQVSHYFDGKIETLAPGRTLIVTFQANETGTFSIYCSIPCTVHWAMQSGRLVVA